MVAARLPADGFVLLACAAQPGVRVMEWQSEQSAAGMRWPMRPWWMWRQARARASTVDRKGQLVPGRWLRGYMMDDPRPALAAIDRPVDPGLLGSIAEWVGDVC